MKQEWVLERLDSGHCLVYRKSGPHAETLQRFIQTPEVSIDVHFLVHQDGEVEYQGRLATPETLLAEKDEEIKRLKQRIYSADPFSDDVL